MNVTIPCPKCRAPMDVAETIGSLLLSAEGQCPACSQPFATGMGLTTVVGGFVPLGESARLYPMPPVPDVAAAYLGWLAGPVPGMVKVRATPGVKVQFVPTPTMGRVQAGVKQRIQEARGAADPAAVLDAPAEGGLDAAVSFARTVYDAVVASGGNGDALLAEISAAL